MSARHDTGKTRDRQGATGRNDTAQRTDEMRASPMMAHLLDALESGQNVGHYGQLTFVMVARFFLSEGEMLAVLARQPQHSEEDASSLIRQVQAHDYNPPKRERILDWQARQDFPICPNAHDPQACNVYRELRFPDRIYDHIEDFWEEHVEEASGDQEGAR